MHAHAQGNLTSAKTLTEACSFSASTPPTLTFKERQNMRTFPPLTWHRGPSPRLAPLTRSGCPNRAAVWQRHRPERPRVRAAPCPRSTPPVPPERVLSHRPQRQGRGSREGGEGPWTVSASGVTETTAGGGCSTDPHPRHPWKGSSVPPEEPRAFLRSHAGRRCCPRQTPAPLGPKIDSIWVSKAQESPTSRHVESQTRGQNTLRWPSD